VYAGISNDESFRLIKKVQDVTNEVVDKLSAISDARKAEIMAS
jgi:ribosome recycling factor